MDRLREIWSSGRKGKAVIIFGGWMILAVILRITGYGEDDAEDGGAALRTESAADGLGATGMYSALTQSGVRADNMRDNSHNCADADCIKLVTTDNVSIYEYADPETANGAATSADWQAVGRFVLRFGGTLSSNALAWPNRESYIAAAQAYVNGEEIPDADPSLGMPGSNGCQLASSEFYDYLTETSRSPISRVYYAPTSSDWFLVVGRAATDEADTATWFTKADPSTAGPFGSFGSEVYALGIPAALVTSLQAGGIEQEEVEGETELIDALAQCAMME